MFFKQSQVITTSKIRPLDKHTAVKEMPGSTKSHKDLSIVSTKQFSSAIELGKGFIGLAISGILGILIAFCLSQSTALDLSHASFIAILIITIVMWALRLVPEYIPSALILLATLLLNIVPQHTVFSGFSSNSFFIAASVFSIGAVITKSRLFYRLSLILLLHLPARPSLLQKFLFFLGILITPIMSVQSSRVALIAPLLDDILESSTIHPRSDTANALANAAFNGCILFSTIFLTGKSSNFIVFGILSEHNQWQGSWLNWLWAASFPGLLLIGLFFILQTVAFKPKSTFKINRFKLQKELYSLGQLSFVERIAIISLIFFAIGSLFTTWKNISSFWICMIIFALLLSTNTLTKKEFLAKINWGFLFYFGAIIGIMHALQNMDFDSWLIAHTQWLTHFASENPFYFIIITYAISWLGGLLLGTMIAPALLFTILIPVASQGMISTWVVGFVILMATEAWIFPYQSSYFLCFEDLLKTNNNFRLSSLLKLNAWFSLLKLGIIVASIPFWYFLKFFN